MPRVPPEPKTRSKSERRTLLGIGRRIAELRIAANLTQQTLAEMLGVTEPRLRELESGRNNTSILTLHRVATALGVALPALFEEPASRVRPGPGRPPGIASSKVRTTAPARSRPR